MVSLGSVLKGAPEQVFEECKGALTGMREAVRSNTSNPVRIGDNLAAWPAEPNFAGQSFVRLNSPLNEGILPAETSPSGVAFDAHVPSYQFIG